MHIPALQRLDVQSLQSGQSQTSHIASRVGGRMKNLQVLEFDVLFYKLGDPTSLFDRLLAPILPSSTARRIGLFDISPELAFGYVLSLRLLHP